MILVHSCAEYGAANRNWLFQTRFILSPWSDRKGKFLILDLHIWAHSHFTWSRLGFCSQFVPRLLYCDFTGFTRKSESQFLNGTVATTPSLGCGQHTITFGLARRIHTPEPLNELKEDIFSGAHDNSQEHTEPDLGAEPRSVRLHRARFFSACYYGPTVLDLIENVLPQSPSQGLRRPLASDSSSGLVSAVAFSVESFARNRYLCTAHACYLTHLRVVVRPKPTSWYIECGVVQKKSTGPDFTDLLILLCFGA